MSRTKSPTTAARRAERQHRKERGNRIAIWTIVITILVGFFALVLFVVISQNNAEDHHDESAPKRDSNAPSIQAR